MESYVICVVVFMYETIPIFRHVDRILICINIILGTTDIFAEMKIY